MPKLSNISVELCDPHPSNPRAAFEDEGLLASIRSNGILAPVVVWCQAGGRYLVLAGHRRIHCAKELGLPPVPAVVWDGHEMTAEQAHFVLLEENIKHKTLSPLEEARVIAQRISTFRKTQAMVAQEFRRAPSWVSERLSLLAPEERPEKKDGRGRPRNEEDPALFAMVNKGVSCLGNPNSSRFTTDRADSNPITPSHVKKARSAPVEAQAAVVRAVEDQKLSILETEKLVDEIKRAPEPVQKEIAEKAAASVDPVSTARELAGKAVHKEQVRQEQEAIEASCADPALVWVGSPGYLASQYANKVSTKIITFFATLDKLPRELRYDIQEDTWSLGVDLESFTQIRDWAQRHLDLVQTELHRRKSGKRATVSYLHPVEATADA